MTVLNDKMKQRVRPLSFIFDSLNFAHFLGFIKFSA